MIQVSEEGQNSIILFAGANRKNTKEYIKEVLKHFEKGDFLLLQNEINLISELIDEGKERGMTIVLNPSPFDRELLYAKMEKVDYFLINEVEGKQITGELQSDHILKEMQKRYPKAGVVLTLGEKGVILSILVDTFSSRISLTMPPIPKSHNTACVLSWEEAHHWQSRSSGCSSSLGSISK